MREEQPIRLTENDNGFEVRKSIIQDLSFEETSNYFEKHNFLFKVEELKNLGFIGPDESYTNLGLLFSDQNPYSVKIAVFSSQEPFELQERYETSGSILKQIEEVISIVEQHNQLQTKIEGMEYVDSYDYPAECIREGILNAFVHRDYDLPESILISIFSDRMEILSPGAISDGYAMNDILLGISSSRNPKLFSIFNRINLIKACGSGFRKIREFYSTVLYKKLIEVSDHAFRLTLPNKNMMIVSSTLPEKVMDETHAYNFKNYSRKPTNEERKTQIQLYLSKEGSITRKEVENLTGVSQALASKILREMIDEGRISRIGKGPGQYYLLTEEN